MVNQLITTFEPTKVVIVVDQRSTVVGYQVVFTCQPLRVSSTSHLMPFLGAHRM
jgi:hypothetical protein